MSGEERNKESQQRAERRRRAKTDGTSLLLPEVEAAAATEVGPRTSPLTVCS
jgi:hypothetical protein